VPYLIGARLAQRSGLSALEGGEAVELLLLHGRVYPLWRIFFGGLIENLSIPDWVSAA